MSAQHTPPEGPLIPMPALTPTALRRAVSQIIPADLPRFNEHLAEAAENAAAQSSVAPLRTFLLYWGMTIAIQRHPTRAARLREMEDAAQSAPNLDAARPALAEIRALLDAAEREVKAGQ